MGGARLLRDQSCVAAFFGSELLDPGVSTLATALEYQERGQGPHEIASTL